MPRTPKRLPSKSSNSAISTRRTKVYVAGPITGSGNLLSNVREALHVGSDLLLCGYAPYIPHLSCYWETVCAHSYEEWLGLDMEYLRVCDAVLRLPGKSKGADREVRYAKQLQIPVYYSLVNLSGQEPAMRKAQ